MNREKYRNSPCRKCGLVNRARKLAAYLERHAPKLRLVKL